MPPGYDVRRLAQHDEQRTDEREREPAKKNRRHDESRRAPAPLGRPAHRGGEGESPSTRLATIDAAADGISTTVLAKVAGL